LVFANNSVNSSVLWQTSDEFVWAVLTHSSVLVGPGFSSILFTYKFL